MNFIYVNLSSVLLMICSVHGNVETDVHLDQSIINTKMSAVEWLV